MPRLDVALTRAVSSSRDSARQALILAGKVQVSGETERRPDRAVRDDEVITVERHSRLRKPRCTEARSGAGEIRGRSQRPICADIERPPVGSPTCTPPRGFQVYAIDVGRGLIHWRLPQDPRVGGRRARERARARRISRARESRRGGRVVHHLEKVLPAMRRAGPERRVVALFKPQFEVGRGEWGRAASSGMRASSKPQP